MRDKLKISLNDYLDQELGYLNGDVPEVLLHQKKQEYRKWYITQYRKQYYQEQTQITLQFPKKELIALRSKAELLQMKLSVYIKSKLEDEDNPHFFTLKIIIDPVILELIDLIEECVNENSMTGLSEALTVLEDLQTKLHLGKSLT